MNKLELMKTANEIRKGIVTAVHSAKSGHPGGSLSAADIDTYLYFCRLYTSAMRGVVKGSCSKRDDVEIFGFQDGYKGLIYGDFKMCIRDRSSRDRHGGSTITKRE